MMTEHARLRIATILLKLLAVGFGLCTLPFLGEGLANLLSRAPHSSSFECILWFGLALLLGSISYGLWRRRRWARIAALWVSILAISLLSLWGFLLASFWGVWSLIAVPPAFLLALIVFFLTSPEAKALFGVSTETVIQRRPTISRPNLLALLLAGFIIAGMAALLLIVDRFS
jgi:hypothetical protein